MALSGVINTENIRQNVDINQSKNLWLKWIGLYVVHNKTHLFQGYNTDTTLELAEINQKRRPDRLGNTSIEVNVYVDIIV